MTRALWHSAERKGPSHECAEYPIQATSKRSWSPLEGKNGMSGAVIPIGSGPKNGAYHTRRYHEANIR